MRRRLASFLVLVLLAAPAWPAGKSARPRVYDLVAGGEQDYTVAPGDNLWAITGRFTMNRMLLEPHAPPVLERPARPARTPAGYASQGLRPPHRAAPRVRRHRDRRRGAHRVL